MPEKPQDKDPQVTSATAISQKTKIEVPADLYFSAAIREFAKDFFKLAGFSTVWQNRLKLVVDELYMNAVKYGSDNKSVIKIEFEVLDNGVRFEISDEGRGAKQVCAEDLKKIVEDRRSEMTVEKTSGRGIAMFTTEWSDRYDIISNHRGGITVIFIKYLEKEELEAKQKQAQEPAPKEDDAAFLANALAAAQKAKENSDKKDDAEPEPPKEESPPPPPEKETS